MDDFEQLQQVGKTPISATSTVGTDARYEPEYDALQAEIDKMANAAGGNISWDNVVSLAHIILSQKSKDLKVACYLGVALVHLYGMKGLLVSCIIITDMVEQYWDGLFPPVKRLRARFNSLSWWLDIVEKYLTSYNNGPIEPSLALQLKEQVCKFDNILSAISENTISLHHLIELTESISPVEDAESVEIAQKVDTSELSKTGNDASKENDTLIVSNTDETPKSIDSLDECRNELKQQLSALEHIDDYFLKTDPTNAIGCRLRRIVAWMPLVSSPPAENNKTMIAPPEVEEKAGIIKLYQNKDYLGVIRAVESRVNQFVFWLDLSRMAYDALEGIGTIATEAKLSIKMETSILVNRMPSIVQMLFSDGTPFADDATKSWIRGFDKPKSSSVPIVNTSNSIIQKSLSKFSQIVSEGKKIEAIKFIQSTINETCSGKDKFQLRLSLIQLLVSMGKNNLALFHVEKIQDVIEKLKLELWDPELALSGYKVIHEVFISEGSDKSLEAAENTLLQISSIDAAAALMINQ
ncbi:type VI secretion system protein TssA [Celerinatantimonas sp. MCCC 1A17872]|uniref:type VI secretion system protein TssA n=1 Tax=Celerinatantimonas sp. MCCC 1A17872 TaxID=3177514 RepID=UPI0038C24FA3